MNISHLTFPLQPSLQDTKVPLLDSNDQSYSDSQSISIISREFSKEGQICPVCNDYSSEIIIFGICKHSFCSRCIKLYLSTQVRQSSVLWIKCLQYGCPEPVPTEVVYSHLTPNLRTLYEKLKTRSEIYKNEHFRWCPAPNCEGYDNGTIKKHKLTCNQCGFMFCYYCNQAWHGSKKCDNGDDYQFEKWTNGKKIKYCPNCRVKIEKDGGCPEMMCPNCNYVWCWICGKERNANNHDEMFCLIGLSKWEFYWYIIFGMIFAPILLPFGVLAFFVIMIEIFGERFEDADEMVKYLAKKKWLLYSIAFVFSPIIVVLMMVTFAFIIGLRISKLGHRNGYYAWWLSIFFGFLIGIVLFIAFVLIWIVLSVAAPICGFFFLLLKLYFIFKRLTNTEIKVEEYPRSLV